MRRFCNGLGLLLSTVLAVAACGGDDAGLDDYYPDLPKPTGEAQLAFAGEVTSPDQLVPGPARSGMVGDFFIKNDKVTFIVQAPTRVIGVVPQGGNVVDAVLSDGTTATVEDHFGELSLIYLLGRTCEPDRIEIVRDGSEGGVAVLRAVGESGNNDFINIKGIGVLPVDEGVDPDLPDDVSCATTYVLAPGSTTLEVHHSLFNNSGVEIRGPLGTLADTGGDTDAWTGGKGFERADISQLLSLGTPSPIDYVIYQGPGVAYGVVPRHATPVPHAQALIAGVSIMVNGNSSILDLLDREKYFLAMPPKKGVLQSYDLVVGKDGAAVEAAFRAGRGEALRPLIGRVELAGGAPAVGARVGVFKDGNGNGMIDPADVDADDDGQPDDPIVTYLDVGADGAYAGEVPADAGAPLLVRAEIKDVGRSPALPLGDAVNLTIPAPIKVDFEILDADTDQPIPGRLVVVGDHPAFPDQRVFETYDRVGGVVTSAHAIRGTTVDLGDGADAPLYLPAGGTYRIYASRGTEWSVASQPIAAGATSADLTFTLKHVNPTPSYLGTDWHVHQVGSPDSPVLAEARVRGAVADGVEMFAVTDHDYVTDLQPLVEQLGLADKTRVLPGIEVTPFAYGHFNAWPMTLDPTTPTQGAIDWGRGMAGFGMLPGEVFAAMRAQGAQMVQVNHPRYTGFAEFQGAWTRANVKYDFDARTIYGDYLDANVPNDWLRLPGESLWSDQFNQLEIWNGFGMADTNGDGLRENVQLDRTMRDWLSMLSLGFFPTPAGNSDTHTSVADPVGMPRTYVRVGDDSAAALADGTAVDAVLQTQTGANAAPRDVVVTNGPWLDIQVGGQPAIGRAFPAASTNGPITLTVTITSPDWAPIDTLEVFANATLDPLPGNAPSALVPLKCWTTRDLAGLAAMDPCAQAPLAAEAMTVSLASLGGPGGYRRYEATVTVTLDAQDIVTRAGATGTDAYLVFRVRGDRAIFPLMPNGAITPATTAAILAGDATALDAALVGVGVPAAAFTSPVFVDFDGGGYRAPFAP